jgi:hypothetical protein
MQLWITKPAGFTGNCESITLLHCGVDLHQRRRGDLVEHQPVRVDQEVVLGTRDARADVREDQVAPAVGGDEAVAGGKVDPQLPFLGADEFTDGGDVHGVSPGVGTSIVRMGVQR